MHERERWFTSLISGTYLNNCPLSTTRINIYVESFSYLWHRREQLTANEQTPTNSSPMIKQCLFHCILSYVWCKMVECSLSHHLNGKSSIEKTVFHQIGHIKIPPYSIHYYDKAQSAVFVVNITLAETNSFFIHLMKLKIPETLKWQVMLALFISSCASCRY